MNKKLISGILSLCIIFFLSSCVFAENFLNKQNNEILIQIISKKGEGYVGELHGWTLDKAHEVLLLETQRHKDIKEITTSLISPDKKIIAVEYLPNRLFAKWRWITLFDAGSGVIKITNFSNDEFSVAIKEKYGADITQ